MQPAERDGPAWLDALTRARVLARLGLSTPPAPDHEGLKSVFNAFALGVPFDNLRKIIALRRGEAGPLPGTRAPDFFDAWLRHGTGGTCWPTSNAMLALLLSLGFAARRVAASMRDLGTLNHGTVKVRLDGGDWLVDSTMFTGEPLPLTDETFRQRDLPCPAEVEPEDGTHVIWAEFPPSPDPMPCRLLVDPADDSVHVDGYEGSRQEGRSPFNQRLYARRNHRDRVILLIGNQRHEKTLQGLSSRECSARELRAALVEDIGLSPEIVGEWADAGGLRAALEPPTGPKPPPVTRLPPSRR